MAGFGDFLQAIQFGLGLAGGFATQAQKERQANEANQLALLKLVKDDEHDLVPLSDLEAAETGPQGFLGKLFGAPGQADTFRVGGRAFKVVPKAPVDLGLTDDAIGAPTTATPTTPAQGRGLPAYNSYGAPIPATPRPSPTVQPSTQLQRGASSKAPLVERTNNPLAIKLGPATKYLVDIGLATIGPEAQDGGNFLQFRDPETGLEAAQKLLTGPVYANLTVDAALRRWSNGGYNGNIVTSAGIDPKTKIQDLTPEQLQTVIKTQARVEHGGTPVLFSVGKRTADFSNQFAGPGATGQVTSNVIQEQQGDFSNQVAAADLTTPSAPGEITFQTPDETVEDRYKRVLNTTLRRYQRLPNTKETRAKLIVLPDQIRKEVESEYRQERNAVQKDVEDLLKNEDDPRIIKAARDVKTYKRFDELVAIKKQTPASNFFTESDEYLRRMIALGQGDKAAIEVYQEGLRRNRTDAQINRVLQTSGYELDTLKKKLALENKAALEKQAALAPGEVKLATDKARAVGPIEAENERKKIELTTSALAEREKQKARAKKQGEASVYTPSSPEMADELTRLRGERTDLPPETTIDELVKFEPEVLTLARQNIDKRKEDIKKLEQNIEADKPLTPAEIAKFVNPKTGARGEARTDGKPTRASNLHEQGMIPVDAAAAQAISARLSVLDALKEMRALAFGNLDDKGNIDPKKDVDGVKHPGIFSVTSGLGSRGAVTVENYLKTLEQLPNDQKALDLKQLESLQEGLLSLFSRTVGGEQRVSDADVIRIAKLFPRVSLANFSLQDSRGYAEQVYNTIERLATNPLNRIIGNGVIGTTEQKPTQRQNPSSPTKLKATSPAPVTDTPGLSKQQRMHFIR